MRHQSGNLQEANKRIEELMPDNAIRIQDVNRCLILRGQEGGSAGRRCRSDTPSSPPSSTGRSTNCRLSWTAPPTRSICTSGLGSPSHYGLPIRLSRSRSQANAKDFSLTWSKRLATPSNTSLFCFRKGAVDLDLTASRQPGTATTPLTVSACTAPRYPRLPSG